MTNSYDGFGRHVTSTTDMGGTARTLSYGYDADGNRLWMYYPDSNFARYHRDGLDRFYYASISNAANLLYNDFDAAGRLLRTYRFAGGNWNNYTTYTYDGISRLSAAATDLIGSSYDVTAAYAYNPASQIVTRSRDNDAYAYTGYTTASTSYTANGLNQYSAVGGAGYTYDANGNLTSDGTTSYSYDVENRLVSTSAGAALSYDPLGRLYRVTGSAGGGTDTRFLYDYGDSLLNPPNSLRRRNGTPPASRLAGLSPTMSPSVAIAGSQPSSRTAIMRCIATSSPRPPIAPVPRSGAIA